MFYPLDNSLTIDILLHCLQFSRMKSYHLTISTFHRTNSTYFKQGRLGNCPNTFFLGKGKYQRRRILINWSSVTFPSLVEYFVHLPVFCSSRPLERVRRGSSVAAISEEGRTLHLLFCILSHQFEGWDRIQDKCFLTFTSNLPNQEIRLTARRLI